MGPRAPVGEQLVVIGQPVHLKRGGLGARGGSARGGGASIGGLGARERGIQLLLHAGDLWGGERQWGAVKGAQDSLLALSQRSCCIMHMQPVHSAGASPSSLPCSIAAVMRPTRLPMLRNPHSNAQTHRRSPLPQLEGTHRTPNHRTTHQVVHIRPGRRPQLCCRHLLPEPLHFGLHLPQARVGARSALVRQRQLLKWCGAKLCTRRGGVTACCVASETHPPYI